MLRKLNLLICVIGSALMLAVPASAHHRDFTFLRDWFLPYKGEMEVESRTFWSPRTGELEQQFEFEYGITDNFAFEPGIAFHRDPGDKLHLDGLDAELRFRFGTYGVNKFLPAMNVEFEHPVDTEEPDHGEIKLIGSYITPKGDDFTVNVNIGKNLKGDDTKTEGEWAVGYATSIGQYSKEAMGYNVGFRVGVEMIGDFQEHFYKLGPTLIYRRDKHFNVLATLALPLNMTSENHPEIRFIMEYEF
jgi:hypothetical protein